jgi:lipopolysaccharide export system protein LptC
MAQRDAWSRAVSYAKVLMPLGALAILSTLFLLSRKVDTVIDLSGFSSADLAQTIANPRFAGVSEDGSTFQFAARAANPVAAKADQMRVDDLNLTVALNDGSSIGASATAATIDMRAKTVTMNDNPVLTTSTGYEIHADAVSIDYGTTRLVTSTGITVTGPAGLISADQLTLTDRGTGASDYQLVFTGNVQMTINPAEQ